MALESDSTAQGDDEHAQGTLSDPEASPSPTPVAADPPSFAESFAAAEQAALGFLVEEHGFRRDEREVGRAGIDRGVFGRVVYRAPGLGQGAFARGDAEDRAASPRARPRAVADRVAALSHRGAARAGEPARLSRPRAWPV
jgi:hypothetical protein